MKVLSVVGARPQFVKAFAVSPAIREAGHDEVLVHTGQHYDEELSDVFFEELDLPRPDYNLGVRSGPHGEQTAAVIQELEPVVREEEPDAVIVYGDTNTTLAGSIVTCKMDPVLAHVEAGVRGYNREMPEETNRVLSDHASDLLLVPSEEGVENLRQENVTEGVHWTGDVMYDAVLKVRDGAASVSNVLDEFGLREDDYVLVTIHRARNTDDSERLESILNALAEVPSEVVFPVHPRTLASMKEYGLYEQANRDLTLVDAVGYLDFIRLLDGAHTVATDSGGVQTEAFFLDTPCVTFRMETEWTETVDSGWNQLVGADPERIYDAVVNASAPDTKPEPYGDGNAADRVVECLVDAVE